MALTEYERTAKDKPLKGQLKIPAIRTRRIVARAEGRNSLALLGAAGAVGLVSGYAARGIGTWLAFSLALVLLAVVVVSALWKRTGLVRRRYPFASFRRACMISLRFGSGIVSPVLGVC